MTRLLIALAVLCLATEAFAGHPPRFRRLPLYLPDAGGPVDPDIANSIILYRMAETNTVDPVEINSSPFGSGNDAFVFPDTSNERDAIPGNALTNRTWFMDGVSHFVRAGTNGLLSVTGGTMIVWFKTTDDNAANAIISFAEAGSDTRLFVQLDFRNSGPQGTDRLVINYFRDGVQQWRYSSADNFLDAFADNEWHQLAMVFDAQHSSPLTALVDQTDAAGTYTVDVNRFLWIDDLFNATTPVTNLTIGAIARNSGLFNPYGGGVARFAIYDNVIDTTNSLNNLGPLNPGAP